MTTGLVQGSIPSPILFNILFDFIVRNVIDDATVADVKFSYGSNMISSIRKMSELQGPDKISMTKFK